ncbi:hypothetical protein C4572_03560 [Candidatus Parcubacteria bacterium]|nr:MAG: hypothetical protein C4572_03560 [Candidatus Parcubacteria bacterium]
MDPINILLIGRSGCGKGTQGKLLAKFLEENDYGKSLYVYTGEKLRSFSQGGNSLAASITKKRLEGGFLLPSFLAVWLWSGSLIEELNEKDNLIMDGSPRTLLEAMMIDDAMEFYGRGRVAPLFIETSEGWSRERLLNRGRKDDGEKSINERLAYFDKQVVPVINYYKNESKHKLVTVNGEQGIESVHKDIIEGIFK